MSNEDILDIMYKQKRKILLILLMSASCLNVRFGKNLLNKKVSKLFYTDISDHLSELSIPRKKTVYRVIRKT